MRVSAIVLAFLEDPWLERCVDSLLASDGVEIEVLLVDNGSTDGVIESLPPDSRLKILQPGENLGFAGGCNFGARNATGEVLAFVNSDAFVDPGALARLSEVALSPGVGIASASLRLAEDPTKLNSAGNLVHFLGLSWVGHFGEPAESHSSIREAPFATGAAMAIKRSLWNSMGGFADEYFAYHEDAELSLRCWQRGMKVLYVPDAVVVHRYEFSRRPEKWFLMERNRIIFLATLFEVRTLVLLAPAILLLEAAVLLWSVYKGWAPQKVGGWLWIIRNRRWIRARRSQVQSERTVGDSRIVRLFAERFVPGNLSVPRVLLPFDYLLGWYWRGARALLSDRGPDTSAP